MSTTPSTELATVQEIDHTEFGKLRCVMIDGVEWFDPAMPLETLGLVDRSSAMSRLHDDDTLYVNKDLFVTRVLKAPPYDPGTYMTLINESGLYSLIMRSRKAKAVELQRWVTKDVLPSIRKTGRYVLPGKELSTPEMYRQMGDICYRLADAEPKAKIHDRVVEVDGGWYVATVGRMFGYTPHQFHRVLRVIGAVHVSESGRRSPSDFWLGRGWLKRRGAVTSIVTPAGLEELERLFEKSALEYDPLMSVKSGGVDDPEPEPEYVMVHVKKFGPKRKVRVK